MTTRCPPVRRRSHLIWPGSIGCRSWWGSFSGWCRTGLFQRVGPEAPSPQGGGRRRHGGRKVLAATVFVATSGCAWQQLPSASFGPSGATANRALFRGSEAFRRSDPTEDPDDAARASCAVTRATTTPTCGDGYASAASPIARKGIESSQRLGQRRWTIERTMSWLAGCRRLHQRYERKTEHFLAFTGIACTLICYRRLAKWDHVLVEVSAGGAEEPQLTLWSRASRVCRCRRPPWSSRTDQDRSLLASRRSVQHYPRPLGSP